MADTREVWVHPVTGGAEATNPRLAVWRFRIILLVLLAALLVAVAYAISVIRGTDSPTSGGVLQSPLGAVTRLHQT